MCINNITIEKFSAIYEFADETARGIADEHLASVFRACYLNTLETTVKFGDDNDIFVITGDIPAMWLRDSSVQMSHYVRLADKNKNIDYLLRKFMRRQFRFILEDPYANAFNMTADGNGWKDKTKLNPNVWERKFEVDSLIYPLWLLNSYYMRTKDKTVFGELFFDAYKVILDTLTCERDYLKTSDYSFERPDSRDSLPGGGRGGRYSYTGMVRSAFRASDDRCEYPFNIPENIFACCVLRELVKNIDSADVFNPYDDVTAELCGSIEYGVKHFGTTEHEKYGTIYVYETDGMGNSLLMDDANVPSLLSLPYLGCLDKNDEVYKNTRRFILSSDNPYYFDGACARGVGSPHTPDGSIWPIALMIEGLTTDDKEEIDRILATLLACDAGTGFMHESFDCNDSEKYTRPWFAWANTLFSIFVMDKVL